MPRNTARCRCPAGASKSAGKWPATSGNGRACCGSIGSSKSGPAVAEPQQRGFGSKLIEGSIAAELGGSARLAFEPAGVRCEIVIPLEAATIRDVERKT